MKPESAPDRGDLVWIDLDPRKGHEQSGKRPALVLSPKAYNSKVGLALFCPVTSQIKGYPFEVGLPPGLKLQGVVLSDQVNSLDWRARKTRFADRVPDKTLREVLGKLDTLLAH